MSRLLVCSPLRLEARAVRRGIGPDADVRRTGYGAAKSASQADQLRSAAFEMLAIAGTGGGLAGDLSPGDLVVGTQVSGGAAVISCPSAPLLAGELRRAGLRARAGQIVTTGRLARGAERERLAASGAMVADLESAPLLAAAAGRPAVVIRAVSDTPQRPLGPATLAGGLAALRSLRLAGPALASWAAAAGPRRVLLAGPRSFCAGVERAIEIVDRALEQQGPPVYVRKQIVHNTHVVAGLERRGAIFVDELSEVPDGAAVVFSAHGVSPAVRDEAARRGLSAIDATCPLVSKVHVEARRFAADGYLVALIGHAGHEEVEGTLGEAPGSTVLVQNGADVASLRPEDPAKVAYLMQTTLSADEAGGIVGELLERFPAARGPGSDDICYATTNRQLAVRAVAAESDLVLVAGSANSSNSRRLVETAERAGKPAYLIDDAGDIELGWLAGASTIGLTAGASAPPAVVDEIVAALGGLGPVEVSERVIATENIRFGLPKEVRR
ncbi:MAG: 4-hydroxy-3-methylbut-2-enyl diphosphate reductase [Streptosporangiaceae bacterium]|jgi:4-hydroxy-3-methylbut-2-enyl diphosphate reductase